MPPMLEQRIQQHFIDSADLKYQAAQTLSKPIADAVQAMLAKDVEAKIKSTAFLPPALHYLLHWASVRLTSQSRWSGKLSPGTLATYLDSIAAPLLTTFAERDLVGMGAEELYMKH